MTASTNNILSMEKDEFLFKDYELKVNYLIAHFSRMWTRFNFFLTIETALLAYSLSKDSDEYTLYLAVPGLFLAFCWYWFARTDNFLVEVYRKQVAHVFHLLLECNDSSHALNSIDAYVHAGCVSKEGFGFESKTKTIQKIDNNKWQGRSEKISVTELGVIFAMVFFLLWIGRAMLYLLQRF